MYVIRCWHFNEDVYVCVIYVQVNNGPFLIWPPHLRSDTSGPRGGGGGELHRTEELLTPRQGASAQLV